MIDNFHLTLEYSGLQGHHVKLYLHTLEKLGEYQYAKLGGDESETRWNKDKPRDEVSEVADVLAANRFGLMTDRMTTLIGVPICRIPPELVAGKKIHVPEGDIKTGDVFSDIKMDVRDVFRPAWEALASSSYGGRRQTTSPAGTSRTRAPPPLEFGTCLQGLFGLRRAGIFQPQEVLLSHWVELQKKQLDPKQISLYELGPPEAARPNLERLREKLFFGERKRKGGNGGRELGRNMVSPLESFSLYYAMGPGRPGGKSGELPSVVLKSRGLQF
eukprot:g11300.t1